MKGLIRWALVLLTIYFVIYFVIAIVGGVALGIGEYLGGIGKYEGRSAEEWYVEYVDSQDKVQALDSALKEANSNIDIANSQISHAKSTTGESYKSMQDAIDSLGIISTVEAP